MNRDSKGRFCKATPESKEKKETKSKIPFFSTKHDRNTDKFNKEPMLLRIKIVADEKKNRFDMPNCINNASIFSKLDLDEQAKFIGNLIKCMLDFNKDCPFDNKADSLHCIFTVCDKCFDDWFFNMYDPETFIKLLGE